MGIPKFFRYISERYPLTSQLIEENKIPEFDNLYLDFNSIIHNCSHPNDADAHFRLSEEQIFTSIFSYVDLLFGKIKPKKLFFMAVDGVAPRAKMNQQRSRRFRTAKEAKEVKEKAEAKGEKLPDEKAFDSNCITPGTPFMTRLSDQLRYFVNKKITEDSSWRDIEVVLSGHEVPGEGEHKIMEYIRLSRAQPDYNPNVRHCLYGLDADLIMLGLLSHDPHFCLLREEVKFGPASRKRGGANLESINFYLLHICLLREYLDLEFHDIEPTLPFPYDLERVIDDFILLAVFVGNDFLPNLPDLHIHENGLERLFEVYKKVLPNIGGYINNNGTIDVVRLQKLLDEMAEWEQGVFEKEYADLNWYKGKQTKNVQEMEMAKKRTGLVLTRPQREMFDKVESMVRSKDHEAKIQFKNTFPAKDRKFVKTLAEELHLDITWDEYDEDDTNLVSLRLPSLEEAESENGHINAEEGFAGDEVDEESQAAVERVLKKYSKARVFDEDEGEGFNARNARSLKEKMDEWKRGYYQGKLEFSYDDPKAMHDLIYRYVEGLQWVMYYYYGGVSSWGWFYNYHYAPRISDLKGVDTMTFHFELGKPFRPYEQLMSVLPLASKDHIPLAYQDLMYDVNSPILDFYPLEFEQDLNGKKAEWEAIVKIPFIDEARLLKSMASRENRLSPEEKRRNQPGNSLTFRYNAGGEPTVYPSSLPGFFPPLHRCMCIMEPFDLPTLDGLHPMTGLHDGVFLGANALAGFPSLQTLPHTTVLGHHGVNIHGSESRNQSMILHIENPNEGQKSEIIAKKLLGLRAFIGWPFLQEAMVVAVSDHLFKYEKVSLIAGGPERVISNPHSPYGVSHWSGKAERIEQFYSKKRGIVTGNVEILLHVRPLKGLKRLETGAFVKDYEDEDKEQEHALQMVVANVVSEDSRYIERPAPPLSEEFPEGSKIFFLGEHAYGVAAQVSATTEATLSVILAFFPSDTAENAKFKSIVNERIEDRYYPSFKAAEILDISGRALSKIASSLMVITSDNLKTNIGLSLKFEAKSLKVVDYSRKNGKHWEFSQKAINLISEYKEKYPEIFKTLDGDGNGMSKASDILSGQDPDGTVRDIKSWLKSKGVRDFEPVSLFCDQLAKDTVAEIEKLADVYNATKSSTAIKKAIVKGIPRQAVLKPSHTIYRLQNQHFSLGDRVTMVQDTGSVPLAAKGVVIGLNAKSMDILWDVPFMAGTTLGDRCSQYRGCSVEFNSCLNLTDPQFIASTNPKVPPLAPTTGSQPFKPRYGPYPAVQPAAGQSPAGGFRPAQSNGTSGHIQIMTNPNRGRGSWTNGRGSPSPVAQRPMPASPTTGLTPPAPSVSGAPPYRGRGRAFLPGFRGRGNGFPDRGRRGFRGGVRGRGGVTGQSFNRDVI